MTFNAGSLAKMLLVFAVICITFGAERCNDNADCTDDDPCTTDTCDVFNDECSFEPIDGCVKCPSSSGDIACIPTNECYAMQCGDNSTSPCEEVTTDCSGSKNFTSLGVMLAVIVIYVIALVFAVRKDRSENAEANKNSVETEEVNPKHSENQPADEEQGKKDKNRETGEDEGCCCECCSCCSCDGDSGDEGKKKRKSRKEKKKGCCGFLKFALCNNPLTRADKITILLCMVFLNIVLSAGLNDKGVVPSRAQQYVIGLISGSAGLPVKTVITLFFGKVPKKYFIIPYGAAYSFCIICFVVTLVYTLDFQQSKANKWLVSTGISTLEDISLIAIGFVIIYFCPKCSCIAMSQAK